ncbi:MAG: neutral/alkaline non-lysosomal ceramidase N-terminal domain-containing protein [Pirellulaceae bacterium]|nr:neutral/alkaline non-lysosomal ceramidase N-terminal domain-containing protein [Pirellulaceae bacterium]HJN13670.1 neutral/alkaline non-lysosomal ceramidase N-terminal domain-containing protein [Pirellulaceae bacterium]
MKRIPLLTLSAVLLIPTAHTCCAADMWKAGVARTVITPSQRMWMSGYAGRDRPAEGTLHDLWAKALVIEDADDNRAVLVTLDLVGISGELSSTIRDRIQDRYGLTRSQIALATSHTHSGPIVGGLTRFIYFLDDDQNRLVDEYAEFLSDRIVAVVGDALTDIAPATLQHGMGSANFAVNRRNNREADVPQLRKDNKLEGPFDHELPVLTVRRDGELHAIVFGYACHSTVLSSYQWSGDWPGFAQIEIEQRHPGVTAMFWAGCGADQNPLPRRTVELAEDYGRQTATAVDEVLSGEMRTVNGRLITRYKEIELAFGILPTRHQLLEDIESKNRYEAARARLLLERLGRGNSLPSNHPYPLQMWSIGDDICFVILGGEVVVDYSLRIKAEISNKTVWVASYANDVLAYIPSRRVLLEGGYEGATSMVYFGHPTVWAQDVEERIMKAVEELNADKQ